jgi:ABC-2 type transport system permease protein
MRALAVARAFLRVTALNELQYRATFVVAMVQSVVALATGLAVLALVFSQTDSLNGWSGPELLALMGVHILLGGVIASTIQPNMERLMQDIRRGTLDFLLTKPDDAQLLASVREFRPWQLVDVVIGIVLVGIGVARLGRGLDAAQVAAFAVALVLGAVLLYCFWLVVTTLAFWLVRMDEVHELFEGLYQSGRWPVSIYPSWLRIGLTFVVPIAFAVTIPAEALTGRLEPTALAGAALFTVIAFLGARAFWRFGLRAYSGASA